MLENMGNSAAWTWKEEVLQFESVVIACPWPGDGESKEQDGVFMRGVALSP